MKNNKRALYESIMNKVSKVVKQSLNEGAGAGYTVTIDGLTATNISVSEINTEECTAKFTADIKPCIVEWSAEDYYNGVDSKGIYYNGILEVPYDKEDKQVDGGHIEGVYYYDDYDYQDEEPSDIDMKSDIAKELRYPFSVEDMFGAGWTHVNLSDDITFNDVEVGQYITIETATVHAPHIASNINWFFENYYQFDELFGYDEDEEINESATPKRFMLSGLKDVLRRFDENGTFAKKGVWHIAKGGYDLWWELYYEGQPIIDCVYGKMSIVNDYGYTNIKDVINIIKSIYTEGAEYVEEDAYAVLDDKQRVVKVFKDFDAAKNYCEYMWETSGNIEYTVWKGLLVNGEPTEDFHDLVYGNSEIYDLNESLDTKHKFAESEDNVKNAIVTYLDNNYNIVWKSKQMDGCIAVDNVITKVITNVECDNENISNDLNNADDVYSMSILNGGTSLIKGSKYSDGEVIYHKNNTDVVWYFVVNGNKVNMYYREYGYYGKPTQWKKLASFNI